ncbi:hypothetical protein DMN91_007670 [Ooceraea biroi]|uniref:Ras-related protein Rab-32 n=1 Tax=Ooceraea biroi TaxID=2015173 RepID=A0A3L8DKT4_OOCBI|nr:ras and EF-hand domain-containing protein homolog isoform X1 [Ooceraea biroi]RLU21054.1 hypothetical protein DMN91_007670 [Ooceraea biroi]
MNRNESTNERGSSPDTVIARSSSEEEKRKPAAADTSGDYFTGNYVTVGDSSSSLDTLTSGSGGVGILSSSISTDDRKRGKFGAFKSSFREGGIFKIKKKARETDTYVEADAEQDDKEVSRQQSQQLENEKELKSATDVPSDTTLKKKKKKSHSLVRKLSLNKFRLSSEQQEARRAPEGGDSSRSQSQSSQESSGHSYSPTRAAVKKGLGNEDILEREKEAKGELNKPEILELEKLSKTVTVVQRKSQPSLTIKSFTKTDQQNKPDTEQLPQQDNASRSEAQCSSTLPYALSKWPEISETKFVHDAEVRRSKLKTRSESDSSASRSSPVEVRRKLSLLEEKRAIFQRRFFDSSSKDTQSDDTVIAVTVADDNPCTTDNNFLDQRDEERKRKARQISVRTFDTFSSLEGTLLEEAPSDYLDGVEEDYTESYNRTDNNYSRFHAAMAAMSSSNNTPNLGVGEKREHLYKILVIGELGAGKTSIIKRYVHQFFSQHYRATIGVDFALKVLNWDPHTIIRLQLWDIAGQERFGNMTRVYYKEAVGAFIVFDVTRSATLDAVVKWKQDLDSKVQLPDGSSIPCVLLANKCDQQKEGLVNSSTKMDEYCKEKNFAGWFETSAKENINIEEAARFLVNKILQNDQMMKGNGVQDQTDGERFTLNQSPTSSRKSCNC